jgi:hypothetical protein
MQNSIDNHATAGIKLIGELTDVTNELQGDWDL